MKLSAKRTKLFYSIGLLILIMNLGLIGFGQICRDCNCVRCGNDRPTCWLDEDGNILQAVCQNQNEEASAQMLKANEGMFDADYNNQITGENKSSEDLKKDPKRQAELKAGKIVKADGTTITFTPIGTVKNKIRDTERIRTFTPAAAQPIGIEQTVLEKRFNTIKKENGLEKALKDYQRLLNNSFVNTPPTFLEDVGKKYLDEKLFEDAIKVLELNAKFNKDSINTQYYLAQAYEQSYNANRKAEAKANALKNYEKVRNNPTGNKELKESASKNITVLRQP